LKLINLTLIKGSTNIIREPGNVFDDFESENVHLQNIEFSKMEISKDPPTRN